MSCYVCYEPIEKEASWTTLFEFKAQASICQRCSNQLVPIEAPTCDYCGRDDVTHCRDCDRWKKMKLLSKNRAVYQYNEFLKELISQFKYRGDYQLVSCFEQAFLTSFRQAFPSLPDETKLVPIPLSEKRLASRAFNQAEALADLLPNEQLPLLKRVEGEKQAKKNRRARLSMKNPFALSVAHEPVPVILIDDIYTTGATIHHAAHVLKANGYQSIASFTLAR